MKEREKASQGGRNRRMFLKNGMIAAGAAGLLTATSTVFGSDSEDRAPITKGDIAILTFLSALEQVEADL